jgi:hypothetical protein
LTSAARGSNDAALLAGSLWRRAGRARAGRHACGGFAGAPLPGLGVADPSAAGPEGDRAEQRRQELTATEVGRSAHRAPRRDRRPGVPGPRLNVACSFVRQERFAEATAEVEALLARAYVPWAREVLEAFDLGALKPRPEMARIRRSMTTAAAAWGADLDDAVLFVGRARAPLKIPAAGPGFFILNPHQEVYAFLPTTGRFRQLTNEDGRGSRRRIRHQRRPACPQEVIKCWKGIEF